MSKLRCIIIEDEPLAAKVLKDYISEVPYLDLLGTFKDAILAADFLRQNRVDLMFLDIHLPRLKGMAFLKTLKNPPEVIITTAYHQYAVEGFELNVCDYLLKPFDFERFLMAIGKIKTPAGETSVNIAPNMLEEKPYIFINVQKKKVKIAFDDIAYIESQKEYIKVVCGNKTYLSKMSTHEIEALLPAHLFRRIHRSFIVSLEKIESYNAEMVEVQGLEIPIGRGYKEVLRDI
jgi:two-component system, LytTR family, response regulator